MKKIFSIAFFLFLAVAVTTSCFAGEPTDKVRVTIDKIVSILESDDVMVEKEKMIRSAMDKTFDWTEMAHKSISKYWGDRTKAEQEEFTDVFADMIQLTLMFNMLKFSGGEIHYMHEQVEGSFVVVKTKLVKDGVETPLDFWLSRNDGAWLVTDFSVKHVRMVKEYGSHLGYGIQIDGFGKLIEKLKAILN